MRDIKHQFLAAAISLLPLACSSTTSPSGHDGASGSPEAGVALDARTLDTRSIDTRTLDTRTPDTTTTEAGHITDTRDANSVDSAALDLGVAIDTPIAVDSAHDSATPRDTAGERIDAPAADTAADTAADVAVDTGPAGLGTCLSPFLVPRTELHSNMAITTSGARHIFTLPCASNGTSVVLQLDIDAPEMLVYADTFGAAWNTALFFSDTCDKPTFPSGQGAAACNDDACGTSQSQVVGVLRSGYHYLIVSGANGESGDVTVHVDRAVVGTTNPIDLASGSGTLQGNVAGGGTTNLCEASGPQSNYWWLTCPDYAGGAFQASNCNTATWNTVLSLQIPRGPILSCDIDDFNCGLGSQIKATVPPGAGINVLTIAGSTLSDSGAYTITYTRP